MHIKIFVLHLKKENKENMHIAMYIFIYLFIYFTMP